MRFLNVLLLVLILSPLNIANAQAIISPFTTHENIRRLPNIFTQCDTNVTVVEDGVGINCIEAEGAAVKEIARRFDQFNRSCDKLGGTLSWNIMLTIPCAFTGYNFELELLALVPQYVVRKAYLASCNCGQQGPLPLALPEEPEA